MRSLGLPLQKTGKDGAEGGQEGRKGGLSQVERFDTCTAASQLVEPCPGDLFVNFSFFLCKRRILN